MDKEKKRQRDARYRAQHREENRAYQALYYEANKDKRKSQAHAHYEANKGMHLEIARRSRLNLRHEVIKAYGGRCACCGESDERFLTIDHIDGGGNAHRLSLYGKRQGSHKFYTWLRKEGFPSGFQLLCWNCNCAKGIYGRCPHKEERHGC